MEEPDKGCYERFVVSEKYEDKVFSWARTRNVGVLTIGLSLFCLCEVNASVPPEDAMKEAMSTSVRSMDCSQKALVLQEAADVDRLFVEIDQEQSDYMCHRRCHWYCWPETFRNLSLSKILGKAGMIFSALGATFISLGTGFWRDKLSDSECSKFEQYEQNCSDPIFSNYSEQCGNLSYAIDTACGKVATPDVIGRSAFEKVGFGFLIAGSVLQTIKGAIKSYQEKKDANEDSNAQAETTSQEAKK